MTHLSHHAEQRCRQRGISGDVLALIHLKVTASTGGRHATTIIFSGLDIAGIPGASIRHDFGRSHQASLIVPGLGGAAPLLRSDGRLLPGMSLESNRRAALVVRLKCQPIEPRTDLFDQNEVGPTAKPMNPDTGAAAGTRRD